MERRSALSRNFRPILLAPLPLSLPRLRHLLLHRHRRRLLPAFFQLLSSAPALRSNNPSPPSPPARPLRIGNHPLRPRRLRHRNRSRSPLHLDDLARREVTKDRILLGFSTRLLRSLSTLSSYLSLPLRPHRRDCSPVRRISPNTNYRINWAKGRLESSGERSRRWIRRERERLLLGCRQGWGKHLGRRRNRSRSLL